VSPSRFVERARHEYARTCLETSDANLDRIAERCRLRKCRRTAPHVPEAQRHDAEAVPRAILRACRRLRATSKRRGRGPAARRPRRRPSPCRRRDRRATTHRATPRPHGVRRHRSQPPFVESATALTRTTSSSSVPKYGPSISGSSTSRVIQQSVWCSSMALNSPPPLGVSPATSPDLAEQRQLLAEPRPRATVSAAAAGPIV